MMKVGKLTPAASSRIGPLHDQPLDAEFEEAKAAVTPVGKRAKSIEALKWGWSMVKNHPWFVAWVVLFAVVFGGSLVGSGGVIEAFGFALAASLMLVFVVGTTKYQAWEMVKAIRAFRHWRRTRNTINKPIEEMGYRRPLRDMVVARRLIWWLALSYACFIMVAAFATADSVAIFIMAFVFCGVYQLVLGTLQCMTPVEGASGVDTEED